MLSSLALLVALPLASAPLPPQDGELDLLVAAEVARAAGEDVEALWGRALELRRAEDLGEEGDLDRALDRLLGDESLSPEGRLLAAAARMQGPDADAGLLSAALIPLLEKDGALSRAAAGLLGNDLFRRLLRSEREALGQALVESARDADRGPEARMAFARAAARVGRGREMRMAMDEMRAFLDSGDPSIRAMGALALASVNVDIDGRLQRELERLARLPDQRGSLAAAYLKQEQLIELYERKNKDLVQRYESGALTPDEQLFRAVKRMITRYHLEGKTVSDEELTAAALDGMLRFMDEHSAYFSPDAYSEFLLDLEAEYGGIGAYVGIDPADELFTISRPIYSGPAYRAGLGTDDKIVRVDGWPTIGEPEQEVIKRLKGEPGTPVKLYVWRRGMDPDLIERPSEDMVVVLNREQIHIPSVSHQMLPGGIGLVELSTFSRGCANELRAAIDDLEDQGLRGLILDLRRNSGGLLTEARNVADVFLAPEQLVVETQYTFGESEKLFTRLDPAIPEDLPVTVLIGRFTASASEIVSGALQDHGRATLLGETSFGKGSVQQPLPVMDVPEDQWEDKNGNGRWDTWEPIAVDHDGDGVVDYSPRVKMTIARYVLPSKRSIHRELDEEGNLLSEGGVEPDVSVPYPLIETWRIIERRRVRDSGAIQKYVTDRWEQHRDDFRKLAYADEKDTARYPDLGDLVDELKSTLPRDDVRALVRAELRRRVQDERGAEFPIGDFQEDNQVQRAVAELLQRFDESPDGYAAYAKTFQPEVDADDRVAALGPEPSARDRVRDAGALIRELRSNGASVTAEDLDRLLGALGYAGDDE